MTDRDPDERERLGRDPGREGESREPDGETTERDSGEEDRPESYGSSGREAHPSETRHEGESGDATATSRPNRPAAGRGWGIAALVVGILALLGSIFGFFNLILALPGLVLGIVAVWRGSRGFGIAAIILSVLAAVIGVLLTIIVGAAVLNDPEFQRMMQEIQDGG